jgi:class 3 adenylate cyclase
MSAADRMIRYAPPAGDEGAASYLVAESPGLQEERFVFYDRIEIGRYEGAAPAPGVLLIGDGTVSRRHCILSKSSDGRCSVRDLSTNGTWLEGRRLVPNVEVEIQVGQVISLGRGHMFRLEVEASESHAATASKPAGRTLKVQGGSLVTVLVGDIRDYTVMVRESPSEVVQRSVNRAFGALEREVARLRGTVKETQGDAILAFWEQRPGYNFAADACRAAIALNERVRELDSDPGAWEVPAFPLRMDWALATGSVVISNVGADRATGMSMIGEPVVLAFRLEKLVTERTGPIVACGATRELTEDEFDFMEIGSVTAKGFDRPTGVYALLRGKREAR